MKIMFYWKNIWETQKKRKKKKSLLNTCVSNGCWKFQGFHSEKMMTANI